MLPDRESFGTGERAASGFARADAFFGQARPLSPEERRRRAKRTAAKSVGSGNPIETGIITMLGRAAAQLDRPASTVAPE